jgi:hypothetical protein
MAKPAWLPVRATARKSELAESICAKFYAEQRNQFCAD